MTDEQKSELINLLQTLKKEGLVPPKMPYEIWLEIGRLFPLPAVEVIITKTGKDFLLTERHDKFWNGLHIPGGYVLAGESIAQSCNRIAQKELGIDVKFEKVIDAHAWEVETQGKPISIICVCKPLGKPNDGKYYSKIPAETIKEHQPFLKTFLNS